MGAGDRPWWPSAVPPGRGVVRERGLPQEMEEGQLGEEEKEFQLLFLFLGEGGQGGLPAQCLEDVIGMGLAESLVELAGQRAIRAFGPISARAGGGLQKFCLEGTGEVQTKANGFRERHPAGILLRAGLWGEPQAVMRHSAFLFLAGMSGKQVPSWGREAERPPRFPSLPSSCFCRASACQRPWSFESRSLV